MLVNAALPPEAVFGRADIVGDSVGGLEVAEPVFFERTDLVRCSEKGLYEPEVVFGRSGMSKEGSVENKRATRSACFSNVPSLER